MYKYYEAARDAAWRTLIACNVKSLPVNLGDIANHYSIDIVRYSKCPLTQLFNPETISGDGFITKIKCDDNKVIFLNDKIKTYGRRRFTIGHELGHGIMNHPIDIIIPRNDEVDSKTDPIEMQANVFSRDILAPACVLYEIGVTTVEQIMQLCDISKTSAEIRLERLNMLCDRGKFYTSPLEAKVRDQFADFIAANKL